MVVRMNRPPDRIVVEMTRKDVHDNLVSIVESMERIRQEGLANLGNSDDQKMDYLRLTGELASCLKAVIKDNDLVDHANAVNFLVNGDVLLRNYDPLQEVFWNSRNSNLKNALDDSSVVLLGDDFVGESQAYHLFQALKYLNINNSDKDAVYETILPVNTLLSEGSLKNPDVTHYLMKQLLNGVVSDGVGVRGNIDALSFVKVLAQAGALYVDVPKEFYQVMKKDFPKTILVKDDGKEYARVVFGSQQKSWEINVFARLQEYAQLDLDGAEESLARKITNLYKFGKEFLSAMKERIGIKKGKEKPPVEGLENKVLFDEIPADNGSKKTQNQWFDYWSSITDGRIMASMGDLYVAFKEIKDKYENGSDSDKSKAKQVLDGLRDDFDWPGKNNWLIAGTRLEYNGSDLNAKISQHYRCNRPDLVKDSNIEVPVYRGVPVTQVVSDPKGLAYLQTLLDTNDNGERIMQTIEFISGKNRNKIVIWTADSGDRGSIPNRVAGFYYYFGLFHVFGGLIDFSGRSRGVLDSPR